MNFGGHHSTDCATPLKKRRGSEGCSPAPPPHPALRKAQASAQGPGHHRTHGVPFFLALSLAPGARGPVCGVAPNPR